MSFEHSENTQGFQFTGNAKEWFGIWIVNLLLSVITLGIYSAWAKVRHKKYFYGNTYIDGRNFDYHATGGQILKGRLVVLFALIVYNIILNTLPVLGLILTLLLVVLMPWLLIRATLFNARMSSFSNVRFNFTGSYGHAFLVFVLYPILCALTLYTTFPILDRAVKRFRISNHQLGTAPFTMDVTLGALYKAAFAAFLWVALVFAVTFAITHSGTPYLLDQMDNIETLDFDPRIMVTLLSSVYITLFIGVIPAVVIYQALSRNAVYNGTSLADIHHLGSDIKPGRYFWIIFSNLIVTLCTFGLMLPWAQVRLARYLADHTSVTFGASVDEFIDTEQKNLSALGDAFADIEGFDIGLPV